MIFLIIGLLAGLLAVGLTGWRLFVGQEHEVEPIGISILFGTTAYAAGPNEPDETEVNKKTGMTPRNKEYLIFGIYLALFVVLMTSLFVTFSSADAARVNKASDILQTTTGFFIGAVTGYV